MAFSQKTILSNVLWQKKNVVHCLIWANVNHYLLVDQLCEFRRLGLEQGHKVAVYIFIGTVQDKLAWFLWIWTLNGK